MSDHPISHRIFKHIQYVQKQVPNQIPSFITLGPLELAAFDAMADEICTIPDAKCKGRGFAGLPIEPQRYPGITLYTRNIFLP